MRRQGRYVTVSKEQLIQAINECSGNRTAAARKLGVVVETVRDLIKRYKLTNEILPGQHGGVRNFKGNRRAGLKE